MFLMETPAAASLAAFIASSLFILLLADIEAERAREELASVSVSDELAIDWKDKDKAVRNTAERAEEKVLMLGTLSEFLAKTLSFFADFIWSVRERIEHVSQGHISYDQSSVL